MGDRALFDAGGMLALSTRSAHTGAMALATLPLRSGTGH
jgi:hypothetical protein